MRNDTRFLGLDVHAKTISVAVAEAGRDGEVRSLGTIPNTRDSVKRLLKKLGPARRLRACYEAGPTGYVLYWQLTELGVECEVVAPTLVPVKAGDRVKTDRRDAEKLARSYRSGDLTAVWVPDRAHEALRDLVRARESAKKDQLRARHRLAKFLLRHGRRPEKAMKLWSKGHLEWANTITFDEPALNVTLADYVTEVRHAGERIERLEHFIDAAVETASPQLRAVVDALQALRGVAKTTAVTIATELGRLSRFEAPHKLMGYAGLVPSEHTSGGRPRRGAITRTGNAHLRRVLVESAWAYRWRPRISRTLRSRQRSVSEGVKAIAWKAQHRLHGRMLRLVSRGKPPQKAVAAVARELLGFIWAIGIEVEKTTLERVVA